ncbi:kinase-like domain-containing protein [Glomus cerebriforme]|uniref:Kinase-like domain-containing protein n=1 Tax=Glomus cerebriforme TaxID=658196 RepID=A0A397SC57_9GLOM|nr:kinase-like domain-containing protein [Glomus cerebriforme]
MTFNIENLKKNKYGEDVLSFGEDLLRLIPTPFATEIRDSLLKIVDLIRSAKDNKKYCDDLFNRLACATETIGMALKHAPAGYEIGPMNLDRYLRILLYIISWIEDFKDSKMTRRILNILTAEKVAKEISRLKQDLDSVVIDMTYHIVATNRGRSMSIIDQSEWEIAALLSGSQPSEALISRTLINDNDIRPDIKNIKRGSRNHVIKKIFRQEPVAEKSIPPFKSEDEIRDFWKEVAIAEYLRDSPHIAKFRGVSVKNGCFYTYYDWAENGDLSSYLTDKRHSNLDWKIKIRLAYEISCALSYCHSKNILHHSVRGRNILLDEFLRPLLTNFQQSRPLTTREITKTPNINTGGPNEDIRWTAPEKISDSVGPDGRLISQVVRYTKECDVFSFGMLMYEIASQSFPFSSKIDLVQIRNIIKSNERPSFKTIEYTSGMPKEYCEIAEKAWEHDPNKRPAISQITEMLYNIYSKLEQNGNNEARYYVGYYWYKGEEYTGKPKDLDKALEYLLPVAKAGHADAQYHTAIIYYEKYEECKESTNADVELYIDLHKQFLDMAVKQNHLNALFIYGQHCYVGKHYAKNMTIGSNMLLAAHYLGHKDAKNTLIKLQTKDI